jgi:hypothetical protein
MKSIDTPTMEEWRNGIMGFRNYLFNATLQYSITPVIQLRSEAEQKFERDPGSRIGAE